MSGRSRRRIKTAVECAALIELDRAKEHLTPPELYFVQCVSESQTIGHDEARGLRALVARYRTRLESADDLIERLTAEDAYALTQAEIDQVWEVLAQFPENTPPQGFCLSQNQIVVLRYTLPRLVDELLRLRAKEQTLLAAHAWR